MHPSMLEHKLYDDAITGDTTTLIVSLEKDPCLLDRVSYTRSNKTPLHVAALKGHTHFVRQVLGQNPQLAEELDMDRSSPLHLASGKGHTEIVRALISAAPGMCWSRDSQGRNPVHVAVENGCVAVLVELVEKCPGAAREKVDRGLSVLGLSVKYGRLEAFKALVPRVSELVNWSDDDGNNILHMAVASKQIEIIRYLIENTKVNVHAKNSQRQTPWTILKEGPQDDKCLVIQAILSPKLYALIKPRDQPVTWLSDKRESIMVVAILIATMAFQAGVTPPGGVWQQDGKDNNGPYRAGEVVIAHNQLHWFKPFVRVNTIAFMMSLSTILLLISGLPFRRRIFMWILMVVMWGTISAVVITYMIAIYAVTPGKEYRSLIRVTQIAVYAWSGAMGILLIGNTVRLIIRGLKSKGIIVWPPSRFRRFFGVNNV